MDLRALVLVGLAAALSAAPAVADRLDPSWQADRARFNDLYGAACAGDPTAVAALRSAAWDDANPVALNNLGVLHSNLGFCSVPSMTYDPDEVRRTYYHSMALGYPIGMMNYGEMLITGWHDHKVSTIKGLFYLQMAADGGVSSAAALLARLHAHGDHGVSRDMEVAGEWLDRATELGLPEADLVLLREELAAEGRGHAGPTPEQPPVAAVTLPPSPAAAPAQGTPSQGPTVGAGASSPVAAAGSGFFMVSFQFPTTGPAPEIGHVQNYGDYEAEVVYVAQVFQPIPSRGCWQATGQFLVGDVLRGVGYGTTTIERLLAESDSRRLTTAAPNDRSDSIPMWSDLDQGIDWHTSIPDSTDYPYPPFYSLADAEAYGPRCQASNVSVSGTIIYPEPRTASGY